VSVLR
jgi:hypothetical protein